MRYREILTFPIALRREAAQPLHEQIADQIAAAVETGTARRGARIPSTRTLADLLGVSRGVVDEAYDILHSRGYLVVRPGSGTFVRPDDPAPSRPRGAVPGTRQWEFDFRPGQLCGEAFPIRAWRAAWRHASYQMPAPVDPPGARHAGAAPGDRRSPCPDPRDRGRASTRWWSPLAPWPGSGWCWRRAGAAGGDGAAHAAVAAAAGDRPPRRLSRRRPGRRGLPGRESPAGDSHVRADAARSAGMGTLRRHA